MSGDPKLDKQTAAGTVPPPRMLGDTDVSLILSFVEKLPEGAHILEVGPWLGGLTVDLASYGHVTVVDRFIWSDANARKYPGIAEPDTSFRSVFEANMAAQGLDVDVIESTLPDLLWEGGPIDFMVIDAPRDAKTLHGCLRAVAVSLKPGAIIVIKHALNSHDFGMGAYLDALAGYGHAKFEVTEQPSWSNICTISVTDTVSELASFDDEEELIANAPVSDGPTDPWSGHALTTYRLAHLARSRRWPAAFAMLTGMEPCSDNIALWDEISLHIPTGPELVLEAEMTILTELVWVHNDVGARLPVAIGPSVVERLRAFWHNNASAGSRASDLSSPLLFHEHATASILSLAPHASKLWQKSIVAIGSDLKNLSVATKLAGVQSFTGIPVGKEMSLEDGRLGNVSFITAGTEVAAAIHKADIIICSENTELPEALSGAIKAWERASAHTVISLK